MPEFNQQTINGIMEKIMNPPNAKPRETVGSQEPLTVLKDQPLNFVSLDPFYKLKEKNKEIITLGNYENSGFEIVHRNIAQCQDSFGVSADRKTFCVCDGMGGEGKFSGQMARYISYELTKDNVSWEQVFQTGGLESLVKTFIENWKKNNSGVDSKDLSGHTTLSICRLNDDGSVKVLQLGDSPIYLKTKNGESLSFGNDSLNDSSTGIYLGVTNGELKTSFNLESNIHTVNNVDSMTLASDWFSDNYETYTQEYNEKWLAWYATLVSPKYFTKNEYNERMALRSHYKKFDPLYFKGIRSEEEVEEMVQRFKRKPDDITIAMVNVNKILYKS